MGLYHIDESQGLRWWNLYVADDEGFRNHPQAFVRNHQRHEW